MITASHRWTERGPVTIITVATGTHTEHSRLARAPPNSYPLSDYLFSTRNKRSLRGQEPRQSGYCLLRRYCSSLSDIFSAFAATIGAIAAVSTTCILPAVGFCAAGIKSTLTALDQGLAGSVEGNVVNVDYQVKMSKHFWYGTRREPGLSEVISAFSKQEGNTGGHVLDSRSLAGIKLPPLDPRLLVDVSLSRCKSFLPHSREALSGHGPW